MSLFLRLVSHAQVVRGRDVCAVLCLQHHHGVSSVSFVGATPFDLATVDPNNFVSYEDLTEEMVLGWIQSVVNSDPGYRDHINRRIDEEIEDAAQPTTEVTSGFPWQDGVDEVTPPV